MKAKRRAHYTGNSSFNQQMQSEAQGAVSEHFEKALWSDWTGVVQISFHITQGRLTKTQISSQRKR